MKKAMFLTFLELKYYLKMIQKQEQLKTKRILKEEYNLKVNILKYIKYKIKLKLFFQILNFYFLRNEYHRTKNYRYDCQE